MERRKSLLSAERLRELLNYDPETGIFRWKVSRGGTAMIGTIAGCLHPDGYLLIRADGKQYLAHRLTWLYMTGGWPEDQIDHINGKRADNRWKNLREADATLNSENQRKAQGDNFSCGLLGVTIIKSAKKNPWQARIGITGKQKHLGYFPTPEAAHEAYLQAKREFHEGCTI